MNSASEYPRLSVVVNNYNYANFLAEALESAIKQLSEVDEIIIVDDGSTDESPDILRHYEKDRGIKLIEQQNQGQMCAVRTGIEAAQGDIVVLLDSDDYFLDGYLQRLRELYAGDESISFVFSNAEIFGSDAAVIRRTRDNLDMRELPAGEMGVTRWAATRFHEYAGSATSGNSLRRPLAAQLMSLPASLDTTIALSPVIVRLLGISKTEARKSGHNADAVIVRGASVLGAKKYYVKSPGFAYRIHGANKFASTSRLGRWYLRRIYRRDFSQAMRQHFSLRWRPTACELREEILGRTFARSLRGKLPIRVRYFLLAIVSDGTIIERASAMKAAIGLTE
ncbi:MAG: glycosyltransferase involved in cell wall biosynthesis [Halioglobus sp.]|jgi:glycosyltransferase involved in cell wall biosynthesis